MDEATRIPELIQIPPRPSLIGSFVKMAAAGVVLAAVAVGALLLTIPDVTLLERCFTTSMFAVKLCPDSPDYVKISGISPYVVHAVVASEDGSFYSHKGFDWHEISESLNTNLRTGKASRGGSTLTQQLAKNVFLSADKSLWRKIKEAYLTTAIERRYSKNFILEKYLNVVEFGPGLYGVKAAAHHYFQTDPSKLHPLQAAYLAHLLPNPKVYSRGFRKGVLTPFSKKSILIILKRMQAYGKLNEVSYERSVSLMGEFPWTSVGYASFSGAPSYDLETNVPMPKPADLDVDSQAVEQSLENNEPSVMPESSADAAPSESEASPEPAQRDVNAIEEDFE